MKILTSESQTQTLFKYLTSSVVPRPIALVSTRDKHGNVNLSPFSFFNVFSANPPILVFSPARRGRDNTTKHTYENLLEHKECVVNIVNFDIVEQMSLSSSEFAKGVNEFVKAGFTELESDHISVPRVKESPIQIECKVDQVIALGDQGGAGNLVLARVICMHIDDDILDSDKNIDPNLLKAVARLGQNYYSKAYGEALFQLNKPAQNVGIGFDALPKEVLNSKVLLASDLAQLASWPEMIDETEVNEYKLIELSELFLEHEDDAKALEIALHKKAKLLIEQKNIEQALMCVLAFNN